MSGYQSIAISLDASDHWKKPYTYDLSGERNLSDKNITSVPENDDTPREIVVTPSDYGTKGELTALMGNASDGSISALARTQRKPWILISIIASTLFFGFSIGFSLGYYALEKGMFQVSSTEGDSQILSFDNIEEGILSQSKKALQFMDEGVFKDTSSQKQQNSLNPLRFPFQPPASTKPRPLVYLTHPGAYALLMDSSTAVTSISDYSNDFFLISSGLDAQINQAYCGVATAVAIVNSLRFIKVADGDDGVDVPTDPVYQPYPYATQVDIFNDCTKANVISNVGGGPGIDGILTPPYGLNMEQVASLLECHLHLAKSVDWKVTIQYVDETHQTVGKMKFDLKNALADPNSRILVNYDRSAIGQNGGGHWSPVGSYSEKEDTFLLLDVAKYKYPPVWVPSDRLFDGMSTQDDCGDWNFPNGQNSLSQEERLAHTQGEYATTMSKLECQSRLRGYVIVSRS
jgi:hypothetical protein